MKIELTALEITLLIKAIKHIYEDDEDKEDWCENDDFLLGVLLAKLEKQALAQ